MSERIETDASALRRMPSQQRSKERVERMLQAAVEIIGERGSDALKMGEVAERAGVSIGSLYQFFPDKSAIIRSLAERHSERGRACIEAALEGVRDGPALRKAFSGLVDIYYDVFLSNPTTRDVWSGMQADRSLREIELADSRANAETLVQAMRRVDPTADPEALCAKAFLIWQLGEATMRLAVSVDRREGDRIVEAYKQMVLAQL